MSADRPEFADVYDAEVWHVYGFLGYRVRSREIAEDLTQITFERALRAWDRYDPQRASVRTWLTAIARNTLIDHRRRGREQTEIAVEPGAADLELGGGVDRYSLGLDPGLAGALDALSDRDRELIALRFGADLSGPEIAALTGLSLANVQQILSRALRALRERLEEPAASGGERADSG